MILTSVHCNDNDEFLDQDNSEIGVKLLLMIISFFLFFSSILLETNEIRDSDFV